MPEILFLIVEYIATVFPLLGYALEELLITMSGGDWGCGATAQLFFAGDETAACEFVNSLPKA